MTLNCGLAALQKAITVDQISLYTLQQMARDNDQALLMRKVAKHDLPNVPLPAIFHSPDHWTYVPRADRLRKLIYNGTGYVLCTEPIGYPVDAAEARTIKGRKGAMVPFRVHNQHSFIGRADNGVEALNQTDGGASEKAPLNTNFTQQVDTNFRLRILMTWQANATGNRSVRLRRNLNGAGYARVNATSNIVRSRLNSWYANQSNATEGIIGPPPPGPPANWAWADNSNNQRVEVDTTGTCNYPITPTTGAYICAEFSIEIIGDDVNDADTIDFRIQRENGVNLSAYLITPTVTVFKPGDVGPTRINMRGGNMDIKGGVVNNQ